MCRGASARYQVAICSAGRKPDLRLGFDVVDELAQRRDPVRLADDMRVQADVHDAPGRRAFGVELIEAKLEHVDAVAGGEAAAREHVEVVDVVRVRHADDRTVDGVDQVGLVVVEIIAVGDEAELLQERRRVHGAADRRRQPRLRRLADHLLVFIERACG